MKLLYFKNRKYRFIPIVLVCLIGAIIFSLQITSLYMLYNQEYQYNEEFFTNLLYNVVLSYNTENLNSDRGNVIGTINSDTILIKRGANKYLYCTKNKSYDEKNTIMSDARYDFRSHETWSIDGLYLSLADVLKDYPYIDVKKILIKDSTETVLHEKRIANYNINRCLIVKKNLGVIDKQSLEVYVSFSISNFIDKNKEKLATILVLFLLIQTFIFYAYLYYKSEQAHKQLLEDLSHSNLHDLKGPINNIKNQLSLIRMMLDSDLKEKALEKLRIQEIRLHEFINDVDLYLKASVSSNGYVLNMNDVDLYCLLEQSFVTHKNRAMDDKIVAYNFKCERDIGQIMVDSLHLSRCIVNLLDNARKYSSEFVEVTLACFIINNEIQISIKDNGYGIKKSDVDKIFTKHYRIKTQENHAGFGIGLYYVKNVLEAHKARITVNSELDRGSEFTIHLPLSVTKYKQTSHKNMKLNACN